MTNIISKYLNPKNDVAFKHIFGEEKNKDILLAMLNAVLKEQIHRSIKKITFIQTIQPPQVAAKKQSIVDVLCQDEDGCQYIIEMQIAPREGFQKRAQYYASKAYVSQCSQGGLYKNLKQVIFLAFTDYILFPNKKAYKSNHNTLDRKTGEQDLTGLSFTFVELPKFSQQCGDDVATFSLEEKFYYFLTNAPSMTKEELNALVGKDKIIRKAFEVLDRYSWNDAQMYSYEQEEKSERDYRSTLFKAKEEGIKKGRKEGVEKGMHMLAQQIKKAGVSQDIIEKAMRQQQKKLKN